MSTKKLVGAARWAHLLDQTQGDAAAALLRYLRGGTRVHRIGAGGSASSRQYKCNGCGLGLGSESARDRPTVREVKRNAAHLAECEVWSAADSAASRLLGAEAEAHFGVAMDAAIIEVSALVEVT